MQQGLALHELIADAIVHHHPSAAEHMRHDLTLGRTLFGSAIDRNLNLVAQDALRTLSASSVTCEVCYDSQENKRGRAARHHSSELLKPRGLAALSNGPPMDEMSAGFVHDV